MTTLDRCLCSHQPRKCSPDAVSGMLSYRANRAPKHARWWLFLQLFFGNRGSRMMLLGESELWPDLQSSPISCPPSRRTSARQHTSCVLVVTFDSVCLHTRGQSLLASSTTVLPSKSATDRYVTLARLYLYCCRATCTSKASLARLLRLW